MVAAGASTGRSPASGTRPPASSSTDPGARRPAPDHGGPFSPDSPQLLTASEDGTAKLWDLEAGRRHRARRRRSRWPTGDGRADPDHRGQVGPKDRAGRRRGDRWPDPPLAGGQAEADRPGEPGSDGPGGDVHARRPLAGGGGGGQVGLALGDEPAEAADPAEPSPQHAEQVNALVAWPNNALIASGSDDTTVRLWNLAEQSLLGTLSAEQGSTDWVAYTPDGLFDSSIGGERQVTWLDNSEVMPLEQFYDSSTSSSSPTSSARAVGPRPPHRRAWPPRASRSTPPPGRRDRAHGEPDDLAGGVRPPEPPALPERRPGSGRGGLRPERARSGSRPRSACGRGSTASTSWRAAPARPTSRAGRRRRDPLRRPRLAGPAARPGHGREQVRRPGPQAPVRRPRRRRARRLPPPQRHPRGGHARPPDRADEQRRDREEGRRGVLQIRDRVKDRPEDTVVVFLAGHADALNGRFYLLLPWFPFPPATGRTGGRNGPPPRSTSMPDRPPLRRRLPEPRPPARSSAW